MRVTAILDIDIGTGEYSVTFRNASSPGLPMDLTLIKRTLGKVLEHFVGKKPTATPPKQVVT